jgi:hypothetical protein
MGRVRSLCGSSPIEDLGGRLDIFGLAAINGSREVHVRVDEVGEPWRTKGCGERSLGGERSGLSMPFVPTSSWEVASPGRGVACGGDKSISSQIRFMCCLRSMENGWNGSRRGQRPLPKK